ncbi:hypothetical protein MMC25_004327 [Agyrium rufum]|nr:hypothetical protein [Agyrium rufum]
MSRIEELPEDNTEPATISSLSPNTNSTKTPTTQKHNAQTTSTPSDTTSPSIPPAPPQNGVSLHEPFNNASATSSSSPQNPPSELPPSPPAIIPPSSQPIGPAPPPAPTETVDDVLSSLQKSPFFMTSLPSPNGAPLDQDSDEANALAAMQALQYDGTRFEVSSSFRESGNEMARAKRWKDAREFYDKALRELGRERMGEEGQRDEDDLRERVEKDLRENGRGKGTAGDLEERREKVIGEERRREREVLEACLVNRGLCELELQNFRSAILTIEKFFTLPQLHSHTPSTSLTTKAHYRLAQAHLSLSHHPEALASCQAGLALSPTNAPLLNLQTRIQNAVSTSEAVAAKKLAEKQKVETEAQALVKALQLRKIRVTKSKEGPPQELEDDKDEGIKLVPDRADWKSSTLVFPVLLLYPEHAKSDFVKAFGEEQMLSGHLSYLFPLPWDGKGEYSIKSTEAFLETMDYGEGGGKVGKKGLVKWGKKVPLLQVLTGGKVEVVDGVVRVFVVPKGRVDGFVRGWKERNGKA